jgi:hypothetical protein
MESDWACHPDESQDPWAQATISRRYAIGCTQKWSECSGICLSSGPGMQEQPALALMDADFRQHDESNAIALGDRGTILWI